MFKKTILFLAICFFITACGTPDKNVTQPIQSGTNVKYDFCLDYFEPDSQYPFLCIKEFPTQIGSYDQENGSIEYIADISNYPLELVALGFLDVRAGLSTSHVTDPCYPSFIVNTILEVCNKSKTRCFTSYEEHSFSSGCSLPEQRYQDGVAHDFSEEQIAFLRGLNNTKDILFIFHWSLEVNDQNVEQDILPNELTMIHLDFLSETQSEVQ